MSNLFFLKPGDKAPAFRGKDASGNEVSLKDFYGKKLALYFYPQDDTPTCTVQACNLRDNFEMLTRAGIQLVGISPDDEISHLKFTAKFGLPFTLVADPGSKIASKYGVWGPKTFMGRNYIGLHRTTFLINEKGKILSIITRPKNKAHGQEILAAFAALPG